MVSIELVLFYKEDVSNLYTSAADTHLLVCKRRLYLSVPPSLAISTSGSTIGYDINRTMMVVTERAAMGRLDGQEMVAGYRFLR